MGRKLSILMVFLMVFSLFSQSGALASVKVTASEEELLHMKFDFGSETSPVAEGYLQVTDKMIYDESRGYGLLEVADSRDQGEPDDLRRDFILANGAEFIVGVPNGDYEVIVTTGSNHDRDDASFTLEEGEVHGGERTAPGEFKEYTATTQVSDGQLNIHFTGEWARVNGVEIIQLANDEPDQPLHLKFDFGTEGSPVAEGYLQVTDQMIYDADRGYGLLNEADSRDQGEPDDLRRDFILAHEAEFMVDLPNGDYEVIVMAGSNNDRDDASFTLEEGEVHGGERTAPGEFKEYTATTQVSDGQLNIHFTGEWARVNGVEIIQLVNDVPDQSLNLMFDFGSETSPVAEGYLQVANTLIYNEEMGYGFDKEVGFRNRGGPDDLLRDFALATDAEFMVDLPNGDYFIRIIAGDQDAFNRSGITIEGEDHGEITSQSGEFSVFTANIKIADEQLNIQLRDDGRINGLEIIPMSGIPILELVETSLSPETYVKLSWHVEDSGESYKIYRKKIEENEFTHIGDSTSTEYTDETAEVGSTYVYAVALVTELGIESGKSNEVTAKLVDESVAIPGVPTGLELEAALEDSVTFKWEAVDEALEYHVYRSKFDQNKYPDYDVNYSHVGVTSETHFTDDSIFTYSNYYYVVYAVNEGGRSEASEILETPITKEKLRQMEKLNRALVAVDTEDGIYIGWKMLGTDPESVSFDIYRDNEKINQNPITTSTNYLDEAGTVDSTYQVRVNNGSGDPVTEVVEVWSEQHLSIPLDKPADGVTPDGETYTYSANDASVGDLTGDGNYEIILKWDPSNSKDNSHSGYTGNVYFDAYTLDGERLWRIDAGKNIRAGAHYSQFLVYDFDGDGKAELVFKTADGTVDGIGNVIGDPNADYRNSGGYVLDGPEFLTVFNGETGAAMETIDYHPPRGNVNDWGDGYGNRVDRFLAGVAYLDGERPSFVMARGYYTRSVLAAYNWRDGKLTEEWIFDSDEPGNGAYAGQGNHSLSVADVDQDGMDEIIYGAAVIDHDGTGLYSTGWGHGDANHVSNLNPNRPGMEIYETYEDSRSPYGYAIRDAETGEALWGINTGTDVGRGLAADIDPRYDGAELWSSNAWDGSSGGSGLFTVEGELITEKTPMSINHAIWWDGDLLRELLDHDFNSNTDPHGVGKIDKWNWETEELETILVPEGTRTSNWTKGNPSLQADILGDWREEVIWPSADSAELRIYTTTDVTEHRIYTLMHDPTYRLGVAWQNVAYNQPPHTGFFLGHNMEDPPVPQIVTEPISSSTSSVSGWVDNGGRKQISNAIVSVTIEGKDYTAITNAHGYFSIQGVPHTDNVTLSAFKDGCESRTELVDIVGSIFQNVSIYCPITNVEFDQTETNLLLDETVQLNVTIFPEDADLNQIEWTSSDSEIASVNDEGIITAHSLGKATITASSIDDSSINATNEVTITGIAVEELILDKSILNLQVDEADQINSLVVPSNAYNKNIIWESSDPKVATVDSQGKVTGISLGTATITATTEDGGLEQSVFVTVQDEVVGVTSIEIDYDAYYFSSDYFSELNADDHLPIKRIEANVLPLEATNKDVIWSSSNPSIAKVDQFGRITAQNSGVAEITATTVDGQFKATVQIYVPVVSESFDNRNEGDRWESGTGTAGGSGNLGGAVLDESGNHVFGISGGGSGVRSTQKNLTDPITTEQVLLDFDWKIGTPDSPGAQLSIEDSAGNRYLTLQYTSGQEMIYGSGGTASNEVIQGEAIGSGFNVDEALYDVQVMLDFEEEMINLMMTNKDNPDIESTVTNIPFDADTEYNGNVGKIQFVLVRPSGLNTSWTTWIDNFNIYDLTSGQDETVVDKSGLENKLGEAKSIANEEGYTESSYTALQEAIEIAEAVLTNEGVTQEEVDTALIAMMKAISGLDLKEEKPEVDKSGLENKLAEAMSIKNEKDYTEVTYAALQEAIASAEETLANEEATQEEIDTILFLLAEAIAGLELKEEEVEVDKSKLENKLVEAKSITNKDKVYTTDSFTALQQAIKTAEAALETIVSVEELDEALASLQQAINGLEKVTVDAKEDVVNSSPIISNEQATISSDDINKLAQDGQFIIDITETDEVEEVFLTSDQVRELINKNADIIIKKSGITLSIPTLHLNEDENVTIMIEQIHEEDATIPKGKELKGDIYKFTIQQKELVSEFTQENPVTLEFSVDEKNVKNTDNLQVFYLNEETGEWLEIGGEYTDRTLVVTTTHFSIFAPMETVAIADPDSDPDPIIEEPKEDEAEETEEDKDETTPSDQDGDSLPKTATSIYSILLAGLILMGLGAVSFMVMKRRKV